MTGAELWRTKLKGSSFVIGHPAGGHIFGGANGELFCLCPTSGDVLWHDKLKGLGVGLVSFTSSSEVATHAALQAAAAAS